MNGAVTREREARRRSDPICPIAAGFSCNTRSDALTAGTTSPTSRSSMSGNETTLMRSTRAAEKADQTARDKQRPTAIRRDNARTNERRQKGMGAKPRVRKPRRLDPGGNYDEQQKSECKNRGKGRRAQGGKRVPPACRQPLLAAAADVINTNRDKWPDQSESGRKRKARCEAFPNEVMDTSATPATPPRAPKPNPAPFPARAACAPQKPAGHRPGRLQAAAPRRA